MAQFNPNKPVLDGGSEVSRSSPSKILAQYKDCGFALYLSGKIAIENNNFNLISYYCNNGAVSLHWLKYLVEKDWTILLSPIVHIWMSSHRPNLLSDNDRDEISEGLGELAKYGRKDSVRKIIKEFCINGYRIPIDSFILDGDAETVVHLVETCRIKYQEFNLDYVKDAVNQWSEEGGITKEREKEINDLIDRLEMYSID